MEYNKNDVDIYESAKYLQKINTENIFIYDYVMEIYYLSGSAPKFNYAVKSQYVNLARLITDNLNYPSNDYLINSRRNALIASIAGGEYSPIVINYNTVLSGEYPELRSVLQSMDKYSVDKVFGNVWVYSLNAESKSRAVEKMDVKIVNVNVNANVIDILIDRHSIAPATMVLLTCGNLVWRYPENGIIFPMKVEQNTKTLYISANSRGISGGDCLIYLESPLDRISLKANIDYKGER